MRAEHLSVANGYVTCGDCDAVFNALQTLVDESAPPVIKSAPPDTAPPPAVSADLAPAIETPGGDEPAGIESLSVTERAQNDEAVPAAPADTPATVPASPAPDRVSASDEAPAPAATAPTAATARDDPPVPGGTPPASSDAGAPVAAMPAPEPVAPLAEAADTAAPAAEPVAQPPARPPAQERPIAPVGRADAPDFSTGPATPPAAAGESAERDAPAPAGATAAVAVPTMPSAPEPPAGSMPGPGATPAGPDPEPPAGSVPGPDAAPAGPEAGAEAGDAAAAMPDDDFFSEAFEDALEPGSDSSAGTGAGVDASVAPGHTLSADEHAILFTEPGVEDGDDEDDDDIEDTVPEYDPDKAPAVLQSDIARLAAGRRTPLGAVWGLFVFALLVAALAQVAWMQRDALVRAVPAARPVVEEVCRLLECGAGMAAGADAIRLLARDVREHPQYREALLVNATLVNTAATPRPYPVIELSLHDAVGSVLGARRFAPGEYLDESIAIDDGMPPDRPVYVVLELGADALAAISFEFTFL